MRITVNGKIIEIENGMTITSLIEKLMLDKRKIAVEQNNTIISRSLHDRTVLNDNDKIEIIQFIGGG